MCFDVCGWYVFICFYYKKCICISSSGWIHHFWQGAGLNRGEVSLQGASICVEALPYGLAMKPPQCGEDQLRRVATWMLLGRTWHTSWCGTMIAMIPASSRINWCRNDMCVCTVFWCEISRSCCAAFHRFDWASLPPEKYHKGLYEGCKK